jgi:integrase
VTARQPNRRNRAAGEGTVYRRQDGRWVAQVSLGTDHNGNRRRLTAYGRTKRQAVDKLSVLRAQAEHGLDSIDRRTKIADFCRVWADTVAPQTIRDTTAAHYRWLLDHYVLPIIGRYRLDELTPEHIARMQLQLRTSGLSVSTVRRARAVLHNALNYAVRTGRLASNPVSLVPPLRRGEQDPQPKAGHLELHEAQQLLAHAVHTELDGVIAIAVALGLRLGEILGLQWDDIDLDRHTLTVNRTLKEARRRSPDGTYLVQLLAYPPKTAKSRRTLLVPDMVETALRRTRTQQREAQIRAGAAWLDSGHVFTHGAGGPLMPSNLRRRYHRLLKDAGVRRVRFHDLRHTAAVLMLQAEAPLEAVSDALGHASIGITKDIYAPAVPELADRAVVLLDQLLTGTEATPLPAAASSAVTNRRSTSLPTGRAGRAPAWRDM